MQQEDKLTPFEGLNRVTEKETLLLTSNKLRNNLPFNRKMREQCHVITGEKGNNQWMQQDMLSKLQSLCQGCEHRSLKTGNISHVLTTRVTKAI